MKIVEIQEDVKRTKKIKIDTDSESTICTIAKDTNDSGVEEIQDSSLKIYKEKTFQVIQFIKELELPKPKQQLRLITKRSFNAVSFIQLITQNEIIEDLIMCVYSINYEAAIIINELLKCDKIKKATILISNLRNQAHREKEQLTKELFVNNEKVKLIFACSHAKIISFKTNKGNYYTIEGSGNLSFNSRIEQYVIDNDIEIFEFSKQWTLDICEFLKGKKELTVFE
jgi:hypothetical protein